MSKYGLTEERYKKMMSIHNNDEEWVKEIVETWTPELCNKGYAAFDKSVTAHS